MLRISFIFLGNLFHHKAALKKKIVAHVLVFNCFQFILFTPSTARVCLGHCRHAFSNKLFSYSGHTVRLVNHINLIIPLEDLVSLWSQMPDARCQMPDEHNRPSTSTSYAPSPVSFVILFILLFLILSLFNISREKRT